MTQGPALQPTERDIFVQATAIFLAYINQGKVSEMNWKSYAEKSIIASRTMARMVEKEDKGDNHL